jgi:protein ImuB
MKIPSYDDLTPGISDVHPRDTFDRLAQFVPVAEPVVAVRVPGAAGPVAGDRLFACLGARRSTGPGALLSLARDFSPRIERHGDASVVLDVSGLGRLLGDAHGIAAALERAAGERGLKILLAVAPTQVAARLLALGAPPGAARVVTGDPAAALAPLALETLQSFVGAPARVFDAARRWGIRTVGELAALPPDELAARFGAGGVAIHRLARGIDPRPLAPDPGVPRFLQTMALEWPIDTLEPLSFVLARLLEPLAQALERADRGAAAVRLDLRLVDKSTHARVLQLPAPMRDPRVLRTLLTLDLESHPPAAGIDVVTIEVDPAPARIVQFSLLERAVPSPETLATLTARLNALMGEDRCGSPVLLDTHRPDAFEMQRFNPDDSLPRRDDSLPRRDDNLLRRFRPPIAVRVGIDRGRPVQVAIDRRGMPGGRIEQAAGPWRGSGDWWKGETHWNRDEWDVAFQSGPVCRIYQDRDTQQWFLDGVFD